MSRVLHTIALATLLAAAATSASAHGRVAGTVVAVKHGPGSVLAVVSSNARFYTLDLRRVRRVTIHGGRISARRGPRIHRLRTAGSTPFSVTMRATVARASASRPWLRLRDNLVFALPARASVRRADADVAHGDLTPGTALTVTWTLSRSGHVTGTWADLPQEPAPVPDGPPTPTPTPAPTPSAPMLFDDEFDGPQHGAPDASKWMGRGDGCDDFSSKACPRDANAYLSGDGNLVLRARREPDGYKGNRFSSAVLGTFAYGTGWPPAQVKAAWAVPYHIEVRALMPNSPGLWSVAWPMNVDRTTSDPIWELDMAEERMGMPTTAGCHQHKWVRGADKQTWDGQLTVPDMSRNWHVYSADVTADRVEYRVDGALCGTGPSGVTGRFGLLLSNVVAAPGSWASGGGQPAAGDGGPWDMKVDYVRVTGT